MIIIPPIRKNRKLSKLLSDSPRYIKYRKLVVSILKLLALAFKHSLILLFVSLKIMPLSRMLRNRSFINLKINKFLLEKRSLLKLP